MELSINTTQFPCIQFKARNWTPTGSCESERVLEIRILTNSEDKRGIILQLYEYEEGVRRVLENAINDEDMSFFELSLIGGSEVSGMAYNKADVDSYKGTKTLFSSAIVIYYRLRYLTEN